MIKLARLFQENCVLQQKKPCIVWGKGEPERTIRVSIQGVSAEGAVNEKGKWEVTLPALTASGEETLVVTDGEETLTIPHVAVGEVWILGGQSNMEFWMRYDRNYKEELEKNDFPDIRFFDYPEVSYSQAEQDFDYSRFGFWRRADRENLEYFSAVGYHFARQLLTGIDVPVGLVGCNWGGTPACAWMSERTLLKHATTWLDEYEDQLKANGLGLDGDYLYNKERNAQVTEEEIGKRAAYEAGYRRSPMANRGNPFGDEISERLLFGLSWEEQQELLHRMGEMMEGNAPDPAMLMGPFHQNRPGGLYRTMLKKVAPFAARGVLWYQGESDESHAELYENILSDMIGDWRALWRDELPFFLVQLAPFRRWMDCYGDNYPAVRAAQERVAERVERVYLASIGDAGMADDIHPKEKKPVGMRLGLLAEKHVYRLPVKADAPEFSEGFLDEKGITLRFVHTGGELIARGDAAREFDIFELNPMRKLEKTEYTVETRGSELRVELAGEHTADARYRVAYCWKDYYEANISNPAGLPLFPFEVTV